MLPKSNNNLCRLCYPCNALTSCGLSDPFEVLFLAAPDSHGSSLDEVLETQVVDTARCQDYVRPGGQDLLDALLGDIRFPSRIRYMARDSFLCTFSVLSFDLYAFHYCTIKRALSVSFPSV